MLMVLPIIILTCFPNMLELMKNQHYEYLVSYGQTNSDLAGQYKHLINSNLPKCVNTDLPDQRNR